MSKISLGCVLLHGFGGRPFEMQSLADCLRQCGYPVVLPTLAGHEGDRRLFDKSRFHDWLGSAEEAYIEMSRHCHRVAVIGFSMGGTLSLALAQKHRPAAVVCISSPIFLCRWHPYWAPDWRIFLSGIVSSLVPILPSSTPSVASRTIAPWEGYEGLHHLRPLHSLRIGAAKTGEGLSKIVAPLLVIHGENDRAVHPDNAWFIARHASSKIREVHLMRTDENVTSGHLLVTHRDTKAHVCNLVSRFLGSIGNIER